MKVKLCGMRREEDIGYANRYRPDYVGFVFAKSPRQVTADRAARLRRLLAPEIGAVGVFVNEPIQSLKEIAQSVPLQVIQLHGDEDAAYVREVKMMGLPVWKAARVRTERDIGRAEALGADALLLDAFSADAYGGTGKTADWTVIGRARPEIPFFLAGGLHAGNAVEAVRRVRPFGIDVSGGIETGGFKDENKIKELMGALERL
ncbi:phosphoribosylanthranilate isomerase [Christensenella intestinihominis]|uniref:phosphoribosylanthranilate isomerase n=1 Tax=Christensenella intestinihominis TaxID=1851429 RepID=UPI00082F90C9|nr:phosphoribosylanthranilate isomerase [Christensenella intestinihominis]